MCGILGAINTRDNLDNFLKALDILRHRGPDDEGYYYEDNVFLGSRRLSVIDLKSGHQPMSNEDGSLQLIHNGEIYNFKELREDLSKKGHIFQTQSDTEAIIHAYEEYGYDCLKELRGMFAFAIWDKNKRALFLARDRLGIKPLYYASLNGSLIFASEIKAMLALDGVNKGVDLEALDQYLSFSWVPDPKTILKGIYKLPPGYFLVYKDGDLFIREYWDLKFDGGILTEKAWIERILDKFGKVTGEHLVSDVPLGIFLSGGVDSSAVLAFMSKVSTERIKAYTTIFREEDVKRIQSEDDSHYARLVARRFNVDHHEITLHPDIAGLLPEVTYYMDEPIADIAPITTYLICRAAGDKLKVLLSGMGGDEIFAGYPWDLGAKWLRAYAGLPGPIKSAICAAVSAVFPNQNYDFRRKLIKFLKVANGQDGILGFRVYFSQKEKGMLYSESMKEKLKNSDPYYKHNEYLKKVSDKDYLTQMLYLDIKTFLPCLNLAYTDKMSMANSIEVRVPFLDHEFVELAASIPSRLKIKGLEQKYIYKKALRGVLPREILQRRKVGFSAPVRAWQEELAPLINDLLSEQSINKRGYFNYDFIKELKNDRERKWFSIWQLLILELWHREFID